MSVLESCFSFPEKLFLTKCNKSYGLRRRQGNEQEEIAETGRKIYGLKKKQNGNLSLPVSLPEEISNAMNCK